MPIFRMSCTRSACVFHSSLFSCFHVKVCCTSSTSFFTDSAREPTCAHCQGLEFPSTPLTDKRCASRISDDTSAYDVYNDLDDARSIKMVFGFDAIEEEDSPYPELVGLVLNMLGCALNVFFNFRSPAPTILQPRPWNVKEHALVFIMSNVSIGSPYALNAVVVGEHYYGLHLGTGFSILLVLATQLTGFGLTGLCRRFLVRPVSMVWPQNLIPCAVLNTLHAEDEDRSSGISHYRYFCDVAAAAFFCLSRYQARILTTQDIFGLAVYEAYSPLYMPTTYELSFPLPFSIALSSTMPALLSVAPSLLQPGRRPGQQGLC
ncbi:OPT oligopeptide transporter protein-domain-containing protein [Vararia minispora EC-137]|uniref:OPT oligopeptide transporter protein-domain-containing protein n=1 Tax=Vararia minispora EC-137 TaxID=1314806 RepID=A0ACB8Q491_9AGAM|nr:OPT oligopeptide transporter protein-domain-containing protein [Vararia minispora EC-137]